MDIQTSSVLENLFFAPEGRNVYRVANVKYRAPEECHVSERGRQLRKTTERFPSRDTALLRSAIVCRLNAINTLAALERRGHPNLVNDLCVRNSEDAATKNYACHSHAPKAHFGYFHDCTCGRIHRVFEPATRS